MVKILEFKTKKYHKSVYLFGHRIITFKSNRLLLQAIADRTENMSVILPYLLNMQNVHPATGYLRDVQLAGVKMLKIVHQICTEHGLLYWINYGTLLGAIRHHSFVPWDDDIDISMMRCDYQRFAEIFNNSANTFGLKAVCYSASGGHSNLIKVIHPDFPVQLDIFPCDYHNHQLEKSEKIKLEQKIRALNDKQAKTANSYASVEAFHQSFRTLHQQNLPSEVYTHEQAQNIKPSIFCGLEFRHASKSRLVYDYDLIFPLKKIRFENNDFYTVAKPELYMLQVFGDFMSLPEKFHTHLELSALTLDQMIAMKKFITE